MKGGMDDGEDFSGLDLALGPAGGLADDDEVPEEPKASSAKERERMAAEDVMSALEAKDVEGFQMALRDFVKACGDYEAADEED